MPNKRLLVVGWDSADWKIIRPLIEQGEMPMMEKILREGVSGDLKTLEPSLSPMLWTTIATGKHAAEHGVHGFTEVRNNQVVPVSASTRKCKAIWNILSEQGMKTNLIGWFASQGERDPNVRLVSNLYPHAPKGPIVHPNPAPAPQPGTYWPDSLANHLSHLRISPLELNRDILAMFVSNLEQIDKQSDPRLFLLAEKLAEAFSIQAAATWLMENEEWDLTMVYFRAIDEISHVFMPFHPPRMEGAPQKDFEHYHDVVNSTYRLHDLMLSRLVDLAGPEAGVLVLSDHGFHSDHLRPRFVPKIPAGIVAWHRSQGIIAAAGNGFKRGSEPVFGANLNDIAPTLLSWFGLARAMDMPGRVLSDALSTKQPPGEIESYENAHNHAKEPCFLFEETQRKTMLEHFVALGYIDEIPTDNTAAVTQTLTENNWQLANALFHSGRYEEALELLEDVHDTMPYRPDVAQRLAQCQLRLGLVTESLATIESSLHGFKDANAIALIRANIASQLGESKKALELLEQVRQSNPTYSGLNEQLARTYLDLRRWEEAQAVARSVLVRDPSYAPGWAIISRCQLHLGQYNECIENALEAIRLDLNNPNPHINLGLALVKTNQWTQAMHAFKNAIKLAPNHIPAHRFLASVMERLGLHEESIEIQTQARKIRLDAARKTAERKDRVLESSTHRQKLRSLRPPKPQTAATKSLDLLIVSGLPRSGTSLMMQILQSGGIPILTDGLRMPDEDNPDGYWEWETIKHLPKKPEILGQAEGKAVKVISALLPSLPRVHRYKIIYMVRPIEQVVASQLKMLERKGITSKQEKSQLEKVQAEHSEAVRRLLRKADGVDLLELDFTSMITDSKTSLNQVSQFLGSRFQLNDLVYGCIKPSLYRQRN